jgi:hypothetical protein
LRNAVAARLTTLRVRRFRILPPLCSLVGTSPSQLVNCFSLAGVYWELGKQSPNALCCEVFSEGR